MPNGGQVSGGTDGTAYPILSDNLGTPRVVLDPATGDRRWAWTGKEAFGFQAPNENPDSVSAGAFVFDARFPGQFLDAETGLFHNGYRDYDAKMGRYVESDPLGLGAGWNTYGYAGGNPASLADPLGLYFTKSALENELFMQAINYLKANSPEAAKIINQAERDPRPLNLDIVSGADEYTNQFNNVWDRLFNGLQSTGGTIHWNPKTALAVACEKGHTSHISPALLLLHEIIHFNDSADMENYVLLSSLPTNDPERWTNALEKSTIERERIAARQLGQGVRNSHNGTYAALPFYTYEATNILTGEQ